MQCLVCYCLSFQTSSAWGLLSDDDDHDDRGNEDGNLE
jgi:hypothetical protein